MRNGRPFLILIWALCLTGCASRYASNPGAAVVGPAYLDYIANYPPDCDTEYYYPGFRQRDFTPGASLLTPLPKPHLTPEVAALLTYVPEPSQHVKDITGKGYPCLERAGLLLFTRSAKQ